jgi:hypothetical protein
MSASRRFTGHSPQKSVVPLRVESGATSTSLEARSEGGVLVMCFENRMVYQREQYLQGAAASGSDWLTAARLARNRSPGQVRAANRHAENSA